MSTRITGGSERGRKVLSTNKAGLRPTSERLRSAIFSIVGLGVVQGARVLDLYAGTGALGIEALSRGAVWAEFVEMDSRRCKDIRQNLVQMQFAEIGYVYRAKVENVWRMLRGNYDLVLVDPPYDLDPWELLMKELWSRQILNQNALVVAEHHKNLCVAKRYGYLSLTSERRHGDSSLSIYKCEEANV